MQNDPHNDRCCPKRYEKDEHTKGACSAKQVITFWLDGQGRWKNCELSSDFYTLLMTNPLVASWWWLVGAVVSSVLWAVLFNEGVFTTPINETAFRYTLYIAAALAAVIYYQASARRRHLGDGFAKLCCATNNIMLALQANAVESTIAGESLVAINSHNNVQYVKAQQKLNLVPRRLAVVLNAILCARRHLLNGELDPMRLPLYADQKAEIVASGAPSTLNTLYAQAAHLMRVLVDQRAVTAAFGAEKLLKHLHCALFHKTQWQALPRIVTNGIWWSQFVLTVTVPLLFSRLYPGYSVVWIAPLVLNFYYAAMKYSMAQCDMMLAHRSNLWSDVAVARMINCAANDNYQIAAIVARQAYDFKNPEPEKQAALQPPPTAVAKSPATPATGSPPAAATTPTPTLPAQSQFAALRASYQPTTAR